MRVLAASVPTFGHVNPMLPLTQALRDAGHDVLWAVASDVCEQLTAAGYATRRRRVTRRSRHNARGARSRPTARDGAAGRRPVHQREDRRGSVMAGRCSLRPRARPTLHLRWGAVLADATYTKAAQRVSAEMAQGLSPEAAIALIESERARR